jgi:hypothetical protein
LVYIVCHYGIKQVGVLLWAREGISKTYPKQKNEMVEKTKPKYSIKTLQKKI